MIFQINANLKSTVLKCVKVGEKCFISEGVTPTSSNFKKVLKLGYETKVSVKYKNGAFSVKQNKDRKFHKRPSKVKSFQSIINQNQHNKTL